MTFLTLLAEAAPAQELNWPTALVLVAAIIGGCIALHIIAKS